MKLNIGDKLNIYYGPRNINNTVWEVRGVVDDDMIILRTPSDRYKVEHVSYLDLLYESKYLTISSNLTPKE